MNIRYDQLVARARHSNINQLFDLFLGPSVGIDGIQAKQKYTRVIKAFGAVDGGDGNPVGGDVIVSFGASVFSGPIAENALGRHGFFQSRGQGDARIAVRVFGRINDRDFRIRAPIMFFDG